MKYVRYCFILLLLSYGCNISDDGAPKNTLFLGAIYNLTGSQSGLDIPSSRGAQLQISEINAMGGVNGKTVQLILVDGETDTLTLIHRTGAVLVENPSTLAFLGLSDTDQVLAAAKVAADNHHVFMTSGATSPKLPSQIPDYLFLACFGDNVQAAAAAEWAYNEMNARTVSVLFDSTDTYTRLLHGYFSERFTELGGQVLTTLPYAHGNVAAAIPDIQPADFIYYAALPDDAPDGVRKIQQAGFNVPIVGGDAYDEPDRWQSEADLTNIYYTTHVYLGAGSPRPEVQAFRDAYFNKYQEEPDAFAALGYDAAGLLIEALQQASNPTPDGVRQALAGIQNYPGVTGSISYAQDQRIPRKSVTILEMIHGTPRFVTEFVPEKVPDP